MKTILSWAVPTVTMLTYGAICYWHGFRAGRFRQCRDHVDELRRLVETMLGEVIPKEDHTDTLQ